MIVFAFHGASFLTLRTTGDLGTRAQRAARTLAIPAVAAGAAFLIWTVVVATDRNDKDVFPPVLPAAIGIVALVLAGIFVYLGRSGLAFTMTAVGSSARSQPSSRACTRESWSRIPTSATASRSPNAASAHYTLAVLTVIAVIVTPIVVLYQAWSYYVFRARITGEEVRSPTDVIAKHAGTSAELP